MLHTIISALTSLSLLTQATPSEAITAQSKENAAPVQVAQVYEQETTGDRVRVKYKPRGWFEYFPSRPLPEEYDNLSEQQRETYLNQSDESDRERYPSGGADESDLQRYPSQNDQSDRQRYPVDE